MAAEHSLVNTTFPVLLPEMKELRLDMPEFDEYVKSALGGASQDIAIRVMEDDATTSPASTATLAEGKEREQDAPFMTALLENKATAPSLDDQDGKMLTENCDVAYRDSGAELVDLFFELEDVVSADRLKGLLDEAWKVDSEATLKIIWNARSIHLGKGSRNTFYRSIGSLAENHPLSLISNLPWLVRPVIQKKVPKKAEKKDDRSNDTGMIDAKDADSDFEIIDVKDADLEDQPRQKKLKLNGDDTELAEFDVKYGVSHGYWKDLLNILALAANDQLRVDGDPKSVLNVEMPTTKMHKRDWTKGKKRTTNEGRHDRVVEKLKDGGFYKALHLTVARLFADQLNTDLARLHSGKMAELKRITLAAKWAPSHKGMHDQHTCIVSTIAELLHPFESICPEGVDPADRELYLKHARITYRSKTVSPLRKHLEVVERNITAETFDKIKYERVPSLAMQCYTPLFAKKDFEHFDTYIENVASGKSRISGATLLPSTLVAAVLGSGYGGMPSRKSKGADHMVEAKLREIQLKSVDAQWNTLVQRIKDSGTLQSSIAVCDVSGSMNSPRFRDGTCPMHSSIGLSLLLAEVTQPPFGGAFITFSSTPQVMHVGGVGDTRSFEQKVNYIENSDWSMNTDFTAVFEKLILPMAIESKLKPEDMVKQVFVFSDMQFDQAATTEDRWTTSYERIQEKFKDAGYEMPQLIFWNLAGGRAGYGMTNLKSNEGGDEAAPKPVTAAEEGTALVSGYSQGQMKMFLDSGGFEDPQEEVVEEKDDEDGEAVVVEKTKKKMDPLAVVKKAISHEAYRMLKVLD